MTGQVKGIPEGASVVIPRLFCRDPAAEIEFCKTTFGAEELNRRSGPDGSLMHVLVTGHVRTIATRVEEPTEEERQQPLALLLADKG